ncbi:MULTISPECIES: DUF3429 domain-containing protein [unclassified Sphingomonas]|nr:MULTISPECIES: DUF3429 domain-containing protein [unclassified Sphingomonas]
MLDRRGRVGEVPLILGYAGLLPQIAALATCFFDSGASVGARFAFGYGVLILSFIGGIWWGFAMRTPPAEEDSHPQTAVSSIAVVPSLVAALLILLLIAGTIPLNWGLVALGSVILTTLLVDRQLVAWELTPTSWMSLRVPLSVGLGTLTILCGVIS